MDDLLARLERHEWRLTPQRQAVIDALQGENVHLSADDVLGIVRRTRPETSRATVYNTLNELVELGEVGELRLAGRSRKYDPNVAHPHHHALCGVCGAVQDIQLGGWIEPELPTSMVGFQVDRLDMVFTGRCADCLD